MFETRNGKFQPYVSSEHLDELKRILDGNKFETAFSAFIKQADENAITGKTHSGQIPFGFTEKPRIGKGEVSTHYGQGVTSQTPYLNYWIVSIYYLSSTGEIVIGIEKNRYPGLKEMKMDYHYAQIGMKKDDLAIFYSTSKNTLNYSEWYENFMKVCKKAIRVYPNKE